MAVLEKIRVKFGILITVFIAFSLLLFIIDADTLLSWVSRQAHNNTVGEIAGKTISYEEFVARQENYKNILLGGSVQNEQQQKQLNDLVWKSFVDDNLFLRKAAAAGIAVGDEEMVELTTGGQASPVITQNPVFQDENGVFSPERVVAFVQEMAYDDTGRYKSYWDYILYQVRVQAIYDKYNALFAQGGAVPAFVTERAVSDNNVSADVDYVSVPFGYVQDSTITVTAAEIKKYYKDHKNQYRQQESREVEFVIFESEPSASDIEAARSAIEKVYPEFKTTAKMESFLQKNSVRKFDGSWYREGELSSLSSQLSKWVDGAAKGAVSELIVDGNNFFAAKVMDAAKVPTSVKVRYIAFSVADKAKADSTLAALKAGKKSTDFTETDWLDKSMGVEVLGDVFAAKKNQPYLASSRNGLFVVEVTDAKEVVLQKKVAVLQKEARPGNATVSSYYAKANTLASKAAGKQENFRKAADEVAGAYVQTTTLYETSERLGGVDNVKEIVRWAFDQKKAGKVSDIKTVNSNIFIVAAVKKVSHAGYTPVEEVSNGIRSVLFTRKSGEKKAAEVAEKIAGLESMEEIAKALDTEVSHKDGLVFSSSDPYGLDNRFVGAVAAAQEGVISAPLVGNVSVYVFRVNSRQTGSFYVEDDARKMEQQMMAYRTQMLLPEMMDAAGVEDHRGRFF